MSATVSIVTDPNDPAMLLSQKLEPIWAEYSENIVADVLLNHLAFIVRVSSDDNIAVADEIIDVLAAKLKAAIRMDAEIQARGTDTTQ